MQRRSESTDLVEGLVDGHVKVAGFRRPSADGGAERIHPDAGAEQRRARGDASFFEGARDEVDKRSRFSVLAFAKSGCGLDDRRTQFREGAIPLDERDDAVEALS